MSAHAPFGEPGTNVSSNSLRDLSVSDMPKEIRIIGCIVELVLAKRPHSPVRFLQFLLVGDVNLGEAIAVPLPQLG